MGLETATYISDLNTANPTGGDPRNQGDDHIRLVKSTIKTTFPSITGAVNASQTELNYCVGVTSSIQTQLNGIIPSGTKMAFYQASPPVGWTATAIQNDSMMRVVTAATTGGTSGAGAGHSPILNNVVPSHTHSVSGTSDNPGNHTHNISGSNTGGGSLYNLMSDGATVLASHTDATSAAGGHTHVITGTAAANAGAANWQPRYMDFCVGTKT